MSDDLPFKAEYAKSGRASCKGCKMNIAQDSLRIAKMVQSPHFDGKMPNWYHFNCFFRKILPKSCSEISKYEGLRWEDQEKIKEKVGSDSIDGLSTPSASKNKKSAFSIEYSKSGQAKCRLCEDKIAKGVLRISKLGLPEGKKGVGMVPRWYHADCFIIAREDLDALDLHPNEIPGIENIKADDKKQLIDKFGVVEKKIKKEDTAEEKPSVNDKAKVALQIQNKRFWEIRDSLSKTCKKKVIQEILEVNNCQATGGESRVLDRCADGILFGAIESCSECPDGKLIYSAEHGYVCNGNISAWTKCTVKTLTPKRKPFVIPKEYREANEFLKKLKLNVTERLFSAETVKKVNEAAAAKEELNGDDSGLPLNDKNIVIVGRLKGTKASYKEKIEALGGKLVDAVNAACFCCISSPGEVLKSSSKMQKVETFDIPVVAEEYVDAIKNGGAKTMITQYAIAPWGGDRKYEGAKKSGKKRKMEGYEGKQKSKKAKVVVKGGAAVDPESEMEDCCHLFKMNGDIYNAILGLVDLTRGSNSYYKLQILEHDRRNSQYYVFRAWGRVGTSIGGTKLEDFDDREDALSLFEELYLEKTGNHWRNRKDFVKKPNCFYPIDIDYGQDDELVKSAIAPGSKSLLPNPVKSLIQFIFDIQAMKDALVEYEIDLKKMPLGKISKRQIESAFVCLTESSNYLKEGTKGNKVLDVSNRFYTLIPHDFGMEKPPLLDNQDLITMKINMLDSLLEIEIAYNILREANTDEDPIDVHYASLKTDIVPLSKDSDEFKMICEYVANTHAKTHSNYSLVVDEVFTVARKGERQRYRPFRDLPNRKLLWHGSRSTNFVGILSQGLRIAPPEAPVTGYMFGKGVYFADMASKSANYCNTNRSNNKGLMLLCEVALGNMYELTSAQHITRLPAGKHSCKGVGKTSPDPSLEKTLPDGVKVPIGTGIQSNDLNTSLLYNEYIIYDASQCNMKYMVQLKFNYAY